MTDAERISSLEVVAAALQDRVKALEMMLNCVGGRVAEEVTKVIALQEGEFTSTAICDQVAATLNRSRTPALRTMVSNKLRKMAAQNELRIVQQTRGPIPTVYERTGRGPAKPGAKPGHVRRGNSGAMSAFRQAVHALPEPFTQTDIRCWVQANRPELKFSFHTSYPLLSRMLKRRELIIHAPGAMAGRARVARQYRRGPVVVMPDGSPTTTKEILWQQLRETIETKAVSWDTTEADKEACHD